MAAQEEIDLRRLYWVGPATVGAAVMAVVVWQKITVAVLPPVSKFSDSILKSNEPAFVTAVLVGGAVLIFPMFVEMASNPAGLCAKGRRGVGNAGPDGDARRGVGGDGSHADATDG